MTIDQAHANVFARLAAPFEADEIEWRVARAGIKNGRPWAQVLAYIDARAARARLNSVLGPANWRVEYSEGPRPGGVIATLSLRVDGEWIAKADGADATDVEPVKGALSSAFKRVCAVWGIGEHLYSLRDMWANFSDTGRNNVRIDGKAYRWDAPIVGAHKSITGPGSVTESAAKHRAPLRSTAAPTMKAHRTMTLEDAGAQHMPFGKHRGRDLRDVPLAELLSAREWAQQKRRSYPGFFEAVTLLEEFQRSVA